MAAPTNAANVKKVLANSEPSTHDTKETSAEHDRMSAFVKKGLGTFGVSYHETFDLFWIKGPLRCKANNFFGYDLE